MPVVTQQVMMLQMTDALDPSRPGWNWSEQQLREHALAVADLVVEALVDGGADPVARRPTEELLSGWSTQEWSSASAAASLWDEVRTTVVPYPFGNAHPRFSAWVNSPPHPLAAMATAVAAAMNPSVAGGNHSAVHLEHQVVRWFRQALDWGDAAGGQLVSGASAAALTALTVARHRACAAVGHDERADGMRGLCREPKVYSSGQAHSCHTKAVEALGIGSTNMVSVDADSDHRMSPTDLDRRLTADRAAGALPIAVLASTGTVNTGAIDPLADIADVCARHGVWLHVDGAYGGPAVLLLDRFADTLAGLARADSISIDPHKWMYVPVDAGVVLFADRSVVRDTFSLVPDYLRTGGDAAEPVWFSEYGLEQTRPFRALKVWVTLRHLGRDRLAQLIARDIAVADELSTAITASDDFELVGHGLSVVCFRHRPSMSADDDALDRHNQAALERVQLRGRSFVAGTRVDGRFAFRACIVNPTTTTADAVALLDEIRTVV